jgi:hypothetical protein
VKRKTSETISDFNKGLNKIYNRIPMDIRPSKEATEVTYSTTFDSDFSLLLRERREMDLNSMQNDTIDIEGNMSASGKVKIKEESSHKNKPNKECSSSQPSSSGNAQDQIFDEITKMIKTLSNKINRLEIGNKVVAPTPQNIP